jgi:APA family basic amino acid/polyamine antiporter
MEDGAGVSWAGSLIAGGAVVAITSVVLTILYGQTRIMFAMCRDGLMPPALAEVNPRTGTPIRLTLTFGILISVLAALVPLTEIIKLVNVGTLFAFILVNIGVVILRHTNPDMERTFRVPFSPVFPIIGVALCIYLMTKLPGETWLRFVFWLAVGCLIYYFYSRKHSRLRTGAARPPGTQLPPGESL